VKDKAPANEFERRISASTDILVIRDCLQRIEDAAMSTPDRIDYGYISSQISTAARHLGRLADMLIDCQTPAETPKLLFDICDQMKKSRRRK